MAACVLAPTQPPPTANSSPRDPMPSSGPHRHCAPMYTCRQHTQPHNINVSEPLKEKNKVGSWQSLPEEWPS